MSRATESAYRHWSSEAGKLGLVVVFNRSNMTFDLYEAGEHLLVGVASRELSYYLRGYAAAQAKERSRPAPLPPPTDEQLNRAFGR